MSHMIRLSVPDTGLANSELRAMAGHGEAYLDHALVWRLFPGDGAGRDFLFRRMRVERGSRDYLIVAKRPPVPFAPDWRCESKSYDPALPIGTWLRFDLRANPTIARKQGGPRGRRHDVLADARYQSAPDPARDRVRPPSDVARDWLLQRADRIGLRIDGDALKADNYTQHRLHRKGRGIRFSSIDYSGLACVADTATLAAALTHGVGHAKGFGCGLLLIRRLD